MTDVVIVSGVRTAIGNYGGALRDIPVVRLGSIVIKEALKRAGLRPKEPGAGRMPLRYSRMKASPSWRRSTMAGTTR